VFQKVNANLLTKCVDVHFHRCSLTLGKNPFSTVSFFAVQTGEMAIVEKPESLVGEQWSFE
jgi:hypothetical protein